MLSLTRSSSQIYDFEYIYDYDCYLDESLFLEDEEITQNQWLDQLDGNDDFSREEKLINKFSNPRKGNWKVVYELKYKHPVKPRSSNHKTVKTSIKKQSANV